MHHFERRVFVRSIKKLLALILVVAIVVLSLPTMAVFADSQDPDMLYGRNLLSKRANSKDLLALYDWWVAQWLDDDSISFPDTSAIGDDYFLVVTLAYSDHPEIFWAVNSSAHSTYNLDFAGGLDAAKAQFDRMTAELTQGLEGKSDYEKARIIHNRLCKNVTYSHSGLHQSAYGAMVQGKSVCAGYARAYQHLLKSVGIPALYVTGSANGGGHAVTLVKLEGKWYYTDVTWDDDEWALSPGYNYWRYNMTTEELESAFLIDSKYATIVPEANSKDGKPYAQLALTLESFDFDKILAALARDEDHLAYVKLTGDYSDFMQQLENHKEKLAENLNAEEYRVRTWSEYIDDEEYLAIWFNIVPKCSHVYTDACDARCNICYTSRKVNNHIYSDTCDEHCNFCGGMRAISHTYDSITDLKCNVCSK